MTGPIDPTAALGAARASGGDDVASKLRRAVARGDEAGLHKAAKQFEGYLVQSMVKQMRSAQSTGDGLFSGSAMSTWNEMFDQEISGRIVEGPGLGLADNLVASMRARYGGAAAPAAAEVLGQGREGWSWPLPSHNPGSVTSGFGHRDDPLGGSRRKHHGLDVAAPEGTPILAVAEGRVVRAEFVSGYGNLVEVNHGDGVVTRYAHQEEIQVSPGEHLEAGHQLGTVGSTGRSTGPHLHLEVRVDGEAVDPIAWLRGTHR